MSFLASVVAGGGGSGSGLTNGDYGDITVSGGGSTMTIDNDAVTYAKIQDVSATDKILGRSTAGGGTVEEIACTSFARSILDDSDASTVRTTLGLGTLATQSGTFSGTSSGTNTGDQNLFSTFSVSGQSDVVADGTGDTITFAEGSNITITTNDTTDTITFSATGASLSDGDYGDITVSDSGSVMTIDDESVTYAKMQHVSATDKILGRSTSGGGTVEEIACTSFARSILDDADASTVRTTLGLGTLATQSGTFSGTSSGTNTGDQNLFSTIAVSGQSDVVADATSDTLTLAEGSNITITTNATTDTITIASTGASLSDGSYSDITVSGSGSVMTINADVVTYDKIQDVSGADKILGRSTAGGGDVEEITCTSFARSILDDTDASTVRSTIGVGSSDSPSFSGATLSGDLTIYEATNDANPEIRLGSADAEELHIQAVYDTGAQTLDYVLFQTDVASATDDKGLFRFNVDGTDILDIDDGGLEVTGSITVSGTVDGRDIATDGSTLDNLDTTIGLSALTSVEVDQLENIGATTISATQWGYLGALDQGLTTTSSVTFGDVTTGGILKVSSDGTAVNADGALTLGAGNDAGIYFDGTDLVVETSVGGKIVLDSQDDIVEIKHSGVVNATFSTNGLDLDAGDAYYIESASVLSATTLGSGVTTSSLTSVGALDSGSITANFGAIDNGISNITTGGILKVDVDGTALNAAGSLTLGAGNDAGAYFDGTNLVIQTDGVGAGGIILDSEDDTVEIKGSGTLQATFDTTGLNLASGDVYKINGSTIISATGLGSTVTTSSLTSVGTLSSVTVSGNANVGSLDVSGDVEIYELGNDANPEIRLGSVDAEELHIQAVYDTGATTLDYVLFQTDVASATDDKGLFRFNVDGTDILDIDDGGLEVTGTVTATSFSGSGSNLTGVAKLNTAQEYTQTQNFDGTTLTDGATVNWNSQNNQVTTLTLGGNRTMAAPTNLKDGATYILIVKQDATGTRTITWNSVFKWPGGTAPTLSTAANAIDIISFYSDGTNMYGVFQGAFS